MNCPPQNTSILHGIIDMPCLLGDAGKQLANLLRHPTPSHPICSGLCAMSTDHDSRLYQLPQYSKWRCSHSHYQLLRYAIAIPSHNVQTISSRAPHTLSPPSRLKVHRCKRQDLTPLVIPQLRSHNTVQSASDRLPTLVDEHTSIVVKAHNAAIRPLVLFLCPDHDRMSDISSSHLVRCRDGDRAARS